MESQCVRIPLKPGQTERFLGWIDSVRPRHSEMIESMRQEGIVFEALLLDRVEGEDSILFYMRAESLQRAQQAFAVSQLAIDVETRQIIEDCWDVARAKPLELCLDLHV